MAMDVSTLNKRQNISEGMHLHGLCKKIKRLKMDLIAVEKAEKKMWDWKIHRQFQQCLDFLTI